MFIHIWRMRARKKRVGDYEKFGRQVTLPSLKKIDGCLGAHFIKIFEARKPEYMWLVFWRDHKALEQARTNPLWREQIKRFEAGKYYKSIPLELVCEALESFTQPPAKPKRPARPSKAAKASKVEESQPEESPAEESAAAESSGQGVTGPMVEGE
ncbi:MAG: hypothetical protein P4N24_06745 [Acidobacteriota bacterium]|nr:hypothetical protein [Acidobacteriota bacterium]